LVAHYFGKRPYPAKAALTDSTYYLKKHIEWLNKYSNIPELSLVVFVVNGENCIKSTDLDDIHYTIKVIQRDNVDGSYGAWNDGILFLLDRPDIDYVLLLEDDYIPTTPEIFTKIHKFFGQNVGYVCQHWEKYIVSMVASVANGLLDMNIAKKIRDSHGRVLNVGHSSIVENQVHFLDYLTETYTVRWMSGYVHMFNSAGNVIQICDCSGDWNNRKVIPSSCKCAPALLEPVL
jgi:hypothetical protein